MGERYNRSVHVSHHNQGQSASHIYKCLRLLLMPVLGFCLRHSIKLQELLECIKVVFLEVAIMDMQRNGVPMSHSRLSVMTGVHRRDTARLAGQELKLEPPDNLIVRIIGQWQQDKRFCTAIGKPRTLSIEQGDFNELIASVSKDLNPYTVLFELERIGAVRRTRQGLKLQTRIYIPRRDVVEGFKLLSRDCEDLIRSVEENVFLDPEIPHLHIKTEYNNIPTGALKDIRRWLIREGSAFHQRARNYISRFDRDINNAMTAKKGRLRVAIGTFSRVEKLEEE